MRKNMTQPMLLMLLGVFVFFSVFFIAKIAHDYFSVSLNQQPNPLITVSATKAIEEDWQPFLKATGSLRAVRGVEITTEVGGKVDKINFKPGIRVSQGMILVELYVKDEVAQLASLKAQEQLAQVVYDRDSAQFAIHAISQATLDTDYANFKMAQAQVLQQKAVIAKKIIRAPFDGQLGVLQVNLGQYLSPGQSIVTLQALDPIWLDFYLPQQVIGQLQLNQSAIFSSDSFPKEKFLGKITTINPTVNENTRNIEIEATVANPQNKLLPGMFAEVQVAAGTPQHYITVPQTAISYSSYGDTVYVIIPRKKDRRKQSVFSVKQIFVQVGEVRGERVAILKGLNAGDWVVTSGQLKLKNGSHVVIDNHLDPKAQASEPSA